MMSIVDKIFGTYSERQIKKLMPIVDKADSLSEKYENMRDSELRAMTDTFRQRLAAGETLDDILPEAFATVREAAARAIGKKPYRVQLLGGIILHQGRIAEMKTGEGKTLVATMPAYLNALTGKGVHIVTVNEYLARRDSEEMGKVYGFLGLTTGLVLQAQSTEEKKKAYAADITYGTNTEIGFDYLRDNMAKTHDGLVQRELHFAIVDEVDSILIDEARTPLIISGPGEKSDDMYKKADAFVRRLRAKVVKEMDTKSDNEDVLEDYIVDEKGKRATLTSRGVAKAESFFGIENLSDPENNSLYHYINEALHAHGVMKRDVDYVVAEGKVLIVDSFTGRIMPGKRFSNGLHQAIEAKERVDIQNENQTLATITYQNLFRLYSKLSGMTGTALTEENEFREIYGLDVIEVPTNKPMIRIDRNDVVYKNTAGKYRAIINQIRECHEKGQPVLVGTVSVEKSEYLSSLLKKEGIQHNVLNAKQHQREAEIVAQAGKFGAVTISTNMAGRGTDIMLGGNAEFLAKNELKKAGYDEEQISLATGMSENIDDTVREARELYRNSLDRFKNEIAPEADRVREAGGLFILGTERHESRRIDNQLRGRSGRQGDPGESRFFLSLEDDLMRLFGSDRVVGVVERLGLPEDEPIEAKIISNTIESSQKRLEGENFNRRKTVLEYDDVMNQQRTVIYKQRREVLDGEDISGTINDMLKSMVPSALDICTADGALDMGAVKERLFWLLSKEELSYENGDISRKELEDRLCDRINRIYEAQKTIFGDRIGDLMRFALLTAVDRAWREHLDAMDDLRDGVGLSSFAQRNPITEYRIAGSEMFDEMIEKIREETVKLMLFASPVQEAKAKAAAAQKQAELKNLGGKAEKRQPVVKKSFEKIGRNDPCPCGSGKKYKQCCGRNAGADN
ncbi:MAG: preprotein translocase subunit SecA [Eubacteriales bacterium]|nr:preprotein translocase subunit SecA [Eubacterium sp.]MDY5493337.1 preprotein translocase subunit SecA [Eubacteriales bacterium]